MTKCPICGTDCTVENVLGSDIRLQTVFTPIKSSTERLRKRQERLDAAEYHADETYSQRKDERK